MNPFMNLHGWTNALKAIAGKHDLIVEFVTGSDQVVIAGNKVTVPVPDKHWQQKDFDNVMYAVDQYGSMWRYGPEAFPDFAELPADKPLGWMMREFEQLRTMREAGMEFKGSKEIMSIGISNRMEQSIIPNIEKMDPKLSSVLLGGAEASTHWNRGYADGASSLIDNVLRNGEAKGCVDKLDKMEFHEKLNELEHPADSLQLAKQVFKELWDEDPDEQEKNERAEGTGGGGAAPKGMGEGTENPHSATDATDEEIGYTENDGHSPEPDPEAPGCHVETTPPSDRHPEFENPDDLIHIDFKKKPNCQPNRGQIAGWTRGHTVSGSNAMFANKLRRLIMVKSQAFYTHGHRRGKLSTRNLYKLCVDHEMPGEDRMFKRKHESDILDTAVSLCVDYSGSMHGNRTALTHIGTDLLVHALNVLGVPVEVNMFSTIHKGTTMYTVKHFDEHVNPELLLDRSERAAYEQSNNNDAAAVMFNYHRLRQRPEKKKLLLVLSDGHPATHNVYHPQEALKFVVQEIEADPMVEIMGLGIESKAVDRYYTQHVVVNRAEDMPTALIDLVANKMLASEEEK